MRLQIFAQILQQFRILGKAIHQDIARALQRRLGIRHAGIFTLFGGEGRFEIFAGFLLGIEHRIGQQRIGQRQQPRFQRDLRLGAAFRFVRQVQVFQPGLVFGHADGGQQLRRHLALLVDRCNDRAAPFLQFTQVAQAIFKQTQLHIIQSSRRFLAVAGYERDSRTPVEQGDGGGDLGRFGGNFG